MPWHVMYIYTCKMLISIQKKANDPSRLFQNRGGQLLKDEKIKKQITKDLPKVRCPVFSLSVCPFLRQSIYMYMYTTVYTCRWEICVSHDTAYSAINLHWASLTILVHLIRSRVHSTKSWSDAALLICSGVLPRPLHGPLVATLQVEKELRSVLKEWENDHERHFVVFDCRYLDTIEQQWDERTTIKEKEKMKRVSLLMRQEACVPKAQLIKLVPRPGSSKRIEL